MLEATSFIVLSESEFDPNEPETDAKLVDEMPTKLLELFRYCLREKVFSTVELATAP